MRQRTSGLGLLVLGSADRWAVCSFFERVYSGWHGLRPCSRARPLPQGSRHLL